MVVAMVAATAAFPAVGLVAIAGAVMAALPAIVVAYDGWYEAIYFAEEDTDPARHLPRAMIGGVLAILGLYLVMNVAFLRVLPVAVLAKSQLAAADAARRTKTPSAHRAAAWCGRPRPQMT